MVKGWLITVRVRKYMHDDGLFESCTGDVGVVFLIGVLWLLCCCSFLATKTSPQMKKGTRWCSLNLLLLIRDSGNDMLFPESASFPHCFLVNQLEARLYPQLTKQNSAGKLDLYYFYFTKSYLTPRWKISSI